MALPYRSTTQTTNAARLSRGVLGPCTDLLRDVLRFYIPQTDLVLKLSTFKTKVRPHVNEKQKDILYPQNSVCTARYDDFDISLLYVLIRNMCKIPPHSNGWGNTPASNDRSLSANVDRIREIRNKYCGHSPVCTLSDQEFLQIWSDIQQIAQETEFKIAGPSTKFKNALDFLKTETMDPDQENHYLDLIDKQKEMLDNVQGEQLKQHEIQVQQGHSLRKQNAQLKKMKASVSRKTRKIEGKQRRSEIVRSVLAKKVRSFESKIDSLDNELEHIIANTEAVLNRHAECTRFTELKAFKTALSLLQKNKVLIISGKCGEGKTTIARQIMNRLSTENTCIILDNLSIWNKVVNCQKKMVILLDDIVGRTSLDYNEVEKHKNKFDIIISCAQKGNIYVIIAIQQDILKDIRMKIPGQQLFDGKYEINLSSDDYKMTAEEKKIMINNCLQHFHWSHFGKCFCWPDQKFHITIDEHDITEIIHSNPYYGFPQTCHLFFTKKEFFAVGPGFFTHPNDEMFKDIESMRKSSHLQLRYCVLVFLFIHKNLDIDNINFDNFKEIASKVRISDFTVQDIKDSVEDLQGPYLSRMGNDSIYTISHETVWETILLSFGQLFPETAIQHSNRRTIDDLIRPEKYRKMPGELVLKIPKSHYPALVDRMFYNLHFDAEDFLQHPVTDDGEFATALFCSHPMQDKKKLYRKIIESLPEYSKPELINAMLKYSNPDCEGEDIEIDGSDLSSENSDFDYFTCSISSESDTESSDESNVESGHESETGQCYSSGSNSTPVKEIDCKEFFLTISEICCIMNESIYKEKVKNVLEICKYISGLPNACDYYSGPVVYNDTMTKYTVLYHCTARDWYEIVEVILSGYTPSKAELILSLNKACRTGRLKSVLPLCRYISSLENASKYFCRKIYDDEGETGSTVLEHCVFAGWDDVVDIILSAFTPTQINMCSILKHCFSRNMKNMVLLLCRFINKLNNADEYFQRKINSDSGCTALHLCLLKGWSEVVDVILTAHTPTKTDKGWSCAHLAAFSCQHALVKKFVNMGQCVSDRTNEGYSLLQCLLLGMRYYRNYSRKGYFDVFETKKIDLPESGLLEDESFHDILQCILSRDSALIGDINLILDKYGNNIIHYIVIHGCETIFDDLLHRSPNIFHHCNSTELPTALHFAVYLGRYSLVKKLWMTSEHPTAFVASLQETINDGRHHCGKTIWLFKDNDIIDIHCYETRSKFAIKIKYSVPEGESIGLSFGSEDEYRSIQDFLNTESNMEIHSKTCYK